ncbi:hypothetical protein NDU88_002094 [Pleurodeles waltl]|uniref:Uncharacterized protein n=1 Tax=Pleurodeles waltl TaxID=8319 RepID=A0AAV7U8U6_PLEWA|nr:hypothetical protein NDU88_002094 [Pleurodeles waltl]
MPRGRAATPVLKCSVTIAGRPQHRQGPRPRPEAALPCRPTGRIFTRALRPLPAPLLQRGDSSGVPRHSRAVRPRTASARGSTRGRGFSREYGPPALVLAAGPGPPANTLWGRHGVPITPGIGPSSAPLRGPRSARRRHTFSRFPVGPSGARKSGVRHLWILGHTLSYYGLHSILFIFFIASLVALD